jgi:hypothetical protein
VPSLKNISFEKFKETSLFKRCLSNITVYRKQKEGQLEEAIFAH